MNIRVEVYSNVEFYEPDPLDFRVNELNQYKRIKLRIIKELANGGPRYCFIVDHIIGPQQYDLIVIKKEAIFSIDLKSYKGRVQGSENGPWNVLTSAGTVPIQQNRNPFIQAKHHRFDLIKKLHDVLPKIDSRFTDVDHVSSSVCFEGGSNFDGVQIDGRNRMWFDVRDELTIVDFVKTSISNQYLLTDLEIDKLLELLGLPKKKMGRVAGQTDSFITKIDGVETLRDILPEEGASNNHLKILIIAKRPAPRSVRIGHYFQGGRTNVGHGPTFWRQLKEYGILKMPKGLPKGNFEDSYLLDNQIGLTDIVKTPGEPGIEPTYAEYKAGSERIMKFIETYQPTILLFLYKKPLEHLLEARHIYGEKPKYGFNDQLNKYFGRSRVFLCPLPGVGGATVEDIDSAMTALKEAISSYE